MFFEVRGINKSFGKIPLLRNINFSAAEGEIISFVGPSGVGKTTLLKIIAGLERPDSGQVLFNDNSVEKQNKPADYGKRNIEHEKTKNPAVMVFQDFLLFPNMTVFDNIAFGLRANKVKKPLIRERVMAMLSCFQIEDKKHHYPAALSAGQRQRVALARAMVIKPAVLLLDEPFANLDKNLKVETAEFIRNTQKQFKTTTLAVMHDQDEAFRMSDRIGVMLGGELVQLDAVSRVFHHPISVEVAAFLGAVNVVTSESVSYLEDALLLKPINAASQAFSPASQYSTDSDVYILNNGHVGPPDTTKDEKTENSTGRDFHINAHGLPPTTNNESLGMSLAINSFQIKLCKYRYYFRSEGATIISDPQGQWEVMEIVFFGTHVNYRIRHIQNRALQYRISSLNNLLNTGERVVLTIHQMLHERIG